MVMQKEIWEAIRTRFGGVGNENSKKNRRLFKQQFEAFTISNSEGKSSTNKVKSGFTGAYSTCTPSTSSTNTPKKEALAGFADEKLFAIRMEEVFLYETGRRVRVDGKVPVGFDKKKLECFNCNNTGHFAREYTAKGIHDEYTEVRDISLHYGISCLQVVSLSHLIKDCDYYEKKMAREAEFKKQRVFNTGNMVAKPVWTNDDRINHANQFVPRPVQLNAGRPNINSVRPNINTGRTNINSVRPRVNTVNSNVNTVRSRQPVPTRTSNSFSPKRPQVNQFNQRRHFSKSHSSVRRPFAKNTAQMSHSHAVKGNWGSAVKTSAGYNWRTTRPNSNCNGGPTFIRTDHPLKNMVDRGIFDSGCLGHMTAQHYTDEDWDLIRAKIEANAELSKRKEAEYVAAANCCGQVLRVQNQLLDYGFNFMNTKIHIDNESTICIVKNPVYHFKTKHIEIRQHFIRDCYKKKLISVEKIHTDLNVADLHSMDDADERGFPRFQPQTATTNTKAEGTLEINATIDTIRGFRGAPRPLLPAMLLVATTNPNAGQEHDVVAHSQPTSSTLPVLSTSSPPVQSPSLIPALHTLHYTYTWN
ncbi:hypothetical protein Tco_0184267 [Tanacetum coccineum]